MVAAAFRAGITTLTAGHRSVGQGSDGQGSAPLPGSGGGPGPGPASSPRRRERSSRTAAPSQSGRRAAQNGQEPGQRQGQVEGIGVAEGRQGRQSRDGSPRPGGRGSSRPTGPRAGRPARARGRPCAIRSRAGPPGGGSHRRNRGSGAGRSSSRIRPATSPATRVAPPWVWGTAWLERSPVTAWPANASRSTLHLGDAEDGPAEMAVGDGLDDQGRAHVEGSERQGGLLQGLVRWGLVRWGLVRWGLVQ